MSRPLWMLCRPPKNAFPSVSNQKGKKKEENEKEAEW